jgi:hypothetical protein
VLYHDECTVVLEQQGYGRAKTAVTWKINKARMEAVSTRLDP